MFYRPDGAFAVDVEADKAIGLILQDLTLDGAGGASLRGKTLGIVGENALGVELARRVEVAFGMTVLQCTSGEREGEAMQSLMAGADIIFLAVPDLPANAGLISAARLNEMKPNAVLVALSARYTIDVRALCHALWFETIGGAAFVSNGLTAHDRAQLAMCDNVKLREAADTDFVRAAHAVTIDRVADATRSMRAA